MKTYPLVEGLQQEYDRYTEEHFAVWKILFERQMNILSTLAAKGYLAGVATVGFNAEKIPDFKEVNSVLEEATGWSLVVVPGTVEEHDFFRLLSQRKFPATAWLRKMNELDYLPEPDMFHDVFGHVPLLSNTTYSDFLQTIGTLGTSHIENEQVIEMLARLYWVTVEFGLIQSDNQYKIYGAGIISSHGETIFCLGETPQHLAYDVPMIMNTPFENDHMQDKYFFISSFEELFHSVKEIKQEILSALSKKLISSEII